MKNFTLLCVLLFGTVAAYAQLKVFPNKRVLIGEGPNPPAHTFETYLGTMAMNFTNRPLWFNIASSDPRIQTTTGGKIVFYNTANSGYIDIQVKAVLTTSDAKFKTNVASIGDNGSALTTVKQLKGVEFNFRDEVNGIKHAGFIAQDLEKVLPHLVHTDDSVGNKAIDYQAIIPYLVEAIKEQQVQIDQLKQKLSASAPNTDTNNAENRLAGEAARDEKRLIHLAVHAQE
ncbi:tail fiber domain-containing protein [Sphingobacterium haloxyli]|uniref:Peptidase S74 domain-containing protein n=1 Tax=Sphingobacterium haloxyli TaxID=2100533 RepID=A0A2S9J823_9SPHI|nr:tail fiber domain-containing protein [Sphingobacterium haloxyli]PRD48921.1 hypothetical protein C5745_03010 [Sphingobacterium haloxyli]